MVKILMLVVYAGVLIYHRWLVQQRCGSLIVEEGGLFFLILLIVFCLEAFIALYIYLEHKETDPERVANEKAFLAILFFLFCIGSWIVYTHLQFRPKAHDASAQSAGRNAKLAQEVYYHDTEDEEESTYTDNLNELLQVDKHLTDDPMITFIFGNCNASGYTFTTRHKCGNRDYVYTD